METRLEVIARYKSNMGPIIQIFQAAKTPPEAIHFVSRISLYTNRAFLCDIFTY